MSSGLVLWFRNESGLCYSEQDLVAEMGAVLTVDSKSKYSAV